MVICVDLAAAMVKSAALLKGLSAREREILELLTKGLSNADIASVLQVSPNTVKSHVANLLRKLEVSNRAEAVGLLGEIALESAADGQSAIPAIAVMPFRASGQTPEEQRQSDGIVDDLITRLGTRWFPVIARCSTYALHEKALVDAREVGRSLDARFLVEGDYRRESERSRLNARLVDTTSGQVVWAQTFDRKVKDLFDVQFELSAAIVHAVEASVIDIVAAEARNIPAPQLAPWERAVGGMSLFWKGDRESNLAARRIFESALTDSPGLRLALYGQALTYQRVVVEQWESDVRPTVLALHQAAANFMNQHPHDSWANLISAYAAIYTGDRDGAEERVERALHLEPSSLRGRSLLGQLLAMRGAASRSIQELELALRISPCSPQRWTLQCAIALAHFAEEQYESSLEWARRAAAHNGAGVMPFGVLATSHAHLGHQQEARDAVAQMQARSPGFSTEQFLPMVASTRPDIAQRFIEGLRRASAN